MKRKMQIGALCLATTALLLAGCSTSPEALPESDYFHLMGELGSYSGMPEANLKDLGTGFCGVRDTADENGLKQTEAELRYLKMATDEGLDASDVGAFFTYATATYCPKYMDSDSIRDLLN